MSDSSSRSCFVDTNIWLYAFIPSQDPVKSVQAKAIIEQSNIVVSSQIVNEVCVNLIRKAQFDESAIRHLIHSFYNRYALGLIDRNSLIKSSELRETGQFSFWDSLIIATALNANINVLYSEDMSNGLVIEGRLTIVRRAADKNLPEM